MEPADLFEQVRDAYLEAFVKAVEVQTSGYAEVLIQPVLNHDDSKVPGTPSVRPFRMPMRQDLVPVKEGSPQAAVVVRGPEPDFVPLTWESDDGFQLAMGPFTWDELRLLVFGIPRDADFGSLVRWFAAWADLNDEEAPDEETGLRLLAHRFEQIEDPSLPEETTAFKLDMGTAPAAALTEFLDLLAELGATTVVIGELGAMTVVISNSRQDR